MHNHELCSIQVGKQLQLFVQSKCGNTLLKTPFLGQETCYEA